MMLITSEKTRVHILSPYATGRQSFCGKMLEWEWEWEVEDKAPPDTIPDLCVICRRIVYG